MFDLFFIVSVLTGLGTVVAALSALARGRRQRVGTLLRRLAIGESVPSSRVFDVAADSSSIGLVVEHPVGPSPGLFVIGGEGSLLRRPTIVRLR